MSAQGGVALHESFYLLYENLKDLIGLHRQLLDLVRDERSFIISSDLNKLYNNNLSKQFLVEKIHKVEKERICLVSQLASLEKNEAHSISLKILISKTQDIDQKFSLRLLSVNNILNLLMQRIQQQNTLNLKLIESSLEHVFLMKKNLFSQEKDKNLTYSQNGKKVYSSAFSKLIFKEI